MCSIIGYLSLENYEEFLSGFEKTLSRGPDMTKIIQLDNARLGFERLAIMGLHEEGMQPFFHKGRYLVCNGEIYGFRTIKKDLEEKGYTFKSDSDCEILLPLYELYGTDMFKILDAEYALIIYDEKTKTHYQWDESKGKFVARKEMNL